MSQKARAAEDFRQSEHRSFVSPQPAQPPPPPPPPPPMSNYANMEASTSTIAPTGNFARRRSLAPTLLKSGGGWNDAPASLFPSQTHQEYDFAGSELGGEGGSTNLMTQRRRSSIVPHSGEGVSDNRAATLTAVQQRRGSSMRVYMGEPTDYDTSGSEQDGEGKEGQRLHQSSRDPLLLLTQADVRRKSFALGSVGPPSIRRAPSVAGNGLGNHTSVLLGRQMRRTVLRLVCIVLGAAILAKLLRIGVNSLYAPSVSPSKLAEDARASMIRKLVELKIADQLEEEQPTFATSTPPPTAAAATTEENTAPLDRDPLTFVKPEKILKVEIGGGASSVMKSSDIEEFEGIEDLADSEDLEDLGEPSLPSPPRNDPPAPPTPLRVPERVQLGNTPVKGDLDFEGLDPNALLAESKYTSSHDRRLDKWRQDTLWSEPRTLPLQDPIIVQPVTKGIRGHESTFIYLHGLAQTAHECPLTRKLSSRFPGSKWVLPQAPVRNVTVRKGEDATAWFDVDTFPYDSNHMEDRDSLLESVRQVNVIIRKERDVLIKVLRRRGGIEAILSGVDPSDSSDGDEDPFESDPFDSDGDVLDTAYWTDEELPSSILEKEWAMSRIVLMGFSQGSVIALLTGLTTRERLGGVAMMSGFLPLRKKMAEYVEGLDRETFPLFWAHGQGDEMLTYEDAVKSISLLHAPTPNDEDEGGLGLTNIEFRTYPGDEYEWFPGKSTHLSDWLERILPKSTPPAGRNGSKKQGNGREAGF